ncbi:MAG: regulatory iron-sulfur-containing complex subunit RicT [Bacteroidales bacterium]|jgi:cell fate regulator YaaT (PSP1 superfamily)|nr:regulatory iron-sulfur-containing complex subunit RicT [Bacteroidales bacterium]
MEKTEQNQEQQIFSPKVPCAPKTGCRKLSVTNWLGDLSMAGDNADYVEIQFKNTRKGYFINSNKLKLTEGDVVAVETSPGHDIGHVTLVGELVMKQMRKNHIAIDRYEFRRVYRMAKPSDIEKWDAVREKEHPTMIRAREIAKKLHLDMKIGDVEYQGDGNKAIFYYIADKRVDFRQLIKDLASEFGIRIEMRQIGARQEAGLIGGIGPCGREICCSKWNSNFASVNTSAARVQELSLNPEKLTGMCAKLKCCLNYEVDVYYEALKEFPSKNKKLESKEGVFRHIKNDPLKGLMTYILNKRDGVPVFATITTARAKEIITLNNEGDVPETLVEFVEIKVDNIPDYENVVGQDDLTRFDKVASNNKKRRNKKRRPRTEPAEANKSNGEPAKAKDPQAKSKNYKGNKSRKKKPKGNNSRRPQAKGTTPKAGDKPNKPQSNKPKKD